MAKCEEGYLCDVCGGDVEELADSDLYLRYVIGQLDPETLHTTRERHIRCNPVLAQFIVADDFAPLVVEGPFDKRQLDPLYVRQRETLVTRGWPAPRTRRPRPADPRLSAARSPRRNRAASARITVARNCCRTSHGLECAQTPAEETRTMPYAFPPDLQQLLDARLATGAFEPTRCWRCGAE